MAFKKISHESHLRVAWELLRSNPDNAGQRMRNTILGLLGAVSRPGIEYNETMTEAWMRILSLCIDRSNPKTFEEFAIDHPEVMNPALLLRYWKQETLETEAARIGWVEPDIGPIE